MTFVTISTGTIAYVYYHSYDFTKLFRNNSLSEDAYSNFYHNRNLSRKVIEKPLPINMYL